MAPGCSGKPAWQNKNRVSSNFQLKDFGHRVCDFIESCTQSDSVEEFSASERSKHQSFESLARELFHFQYEHNAPYRRICEYRGVSPGSLTSWKDIPAVPTSAFKELEISCIEPKKRTRVFHSSGTTSQQPSRHFHHGESLRIYEGSLWSWFQVRFAKAVNAPAARLSFISLTPRAEDSPHSSLAHMFEFLSEKPIWASTDFMGSIGADGGWTLPLKGTAAVLQRCVSEQQPVLLVGTAFLFVHLLDYLEESETRLKLPHGSMIMETGGYKGRSRTVPKEKLYQQLAETLGVTAGEIVSEYGMSELSSQGYDTISRRLYFPPWARVQIVSPETGGEVSEGETGLVRVFDLANVYSVMAVQTEDLGVSHGNGFELLGRATAAEPRGCSLLAV